MNFAESDKPSFFISYSRNDTGYVKRLAGQLEEAGLPIWYDAHLVVGSRFARDTRNMITRALGVIVVMSGASQESEWVEREVLEAQLHDRLIIPILLSGERFFLLASTHYFDARGGTLLDERTLGLLHRVRDAYSPATRHTWLPPAPPSAAPASRPTDEASLRKLRACLFDGRVEHADILTTSLLLAPAGRLADGGLRRGDGARLSYGLLGEIDAAWAERSGGTQGFRAQLGVHPGPPPGTPAGQAGDFYALADSLGWLRDRRAIPPYGEFVPPAPYPHGFFPTLRNPQIEAHKGWHARWRQTVMAVHLRLRGQGGT
ncbi:toll/interleukin-1 receptor domain-containing protein [Sphaerisporangium melleum]|uniref:toll/interleukin-1 receptor domain-containing protein n=1 Tax=Sphaerisporangium melleum TaxID=321316 RepID=UPI0019503188|nr:toll/interleukin-1 receptor domain-containing protein [Sphaerisporangium melleum]